MGKKRESLEEVKQRYAVTALAIQEMARIIRWAIVGGLSLAGLWIVADVVKPLLSQQPTWMDLAKLALVIIGGYATPQVPQWLSWVWFKVYISTHADHTAKVEAIVDATRSSSGVNKDGSHDLDK
jgi:hypothetical protein